MSKYHANIRNKLESLGCSLLWQEALPCSESPHLWNTGTASLRLEGNAGNAKDLKLVPDSFTVWTNLNYLPTVIPVSKRGFPSHSSPSCRLSSFSSMLQVCLTFDSESFALPFIHSFFLFKLSPTDAKGGASCARYTGPRWEKTTESRRTEISTTFSGTDDVIMMSRRHPRDRPWRGRRCPCPRIAVRCLQKMELAGFVL